MFDGNCPIENWKKEEQALQEVSELKNRKKEIESFQAEWIKYIVDITSEACNKIDAKIDLINSKIQKYARDNSDDVKLEKQDGVEKGEIVLGNFRLEVVKMISIKKAVAGKPIKEDNSDNEILFEDSVPAENFERVPGTQQV
jgi:hypothetical protein